jgi:hypothetical protein
MFVIFRKHQKRSNNGRNQKIFAQDFLSVSLSTFLSLSTFVYLSPCLSLFLYLLSLTFTWLFSEGTKKDPVMEEIKKIFATFIR